MTTTIWGLVLLATVLVPGHVFRRFQSRFLVLPAPGSPNEHLLELAITGMWNLALTWPLLSAIGIDPLGALLSAQDMPTLVAAIHRHGLVWLFQILIAPAIWAVIAAYVVRKGVIQRALSFAGIIPQPQCAQAFDAAFFAHRDVAVLVSVTLKDGTVLHGGWDPGSAVSSSSNERDIFLSSVYVLDEEEEEFVQSDSSSGILIRGSEVAYLVFSDVPVVYGEGSDEDDEDAIEETQNG